MPGQLFVDCDRLELRTVEREDADFLRTALNHPEVRRYLDVFQGPYPAERFEDELLDRHFDGDCEALLACRDGEPLGSVALDPVQEYRDWANFAVWFLPEHQGQGYATEASAGLLDYAFGERGLRRLSAAVAAPNEASRALCERLGFTREGVRREDALVDGEYVDRYVYGLLRAEWDPEAVGGA